MTVLRIIAGIPLIAGITLTVLVLSPLIVVYLICAGFSALSDFALTGEWQFRTDLW